MGRIEEMIKYAESCASYWNETGKCYRNGYPPFDCKTCTSYKEKEKVEPHKGVE